MDAQARDEWHKSLEKDDIPAISEDNILSTFRQLHQSKEEVFERGVINVFKNLSWDYKTNNPCYFGKKIIVNNLVKYDKWGYSLSWGWRRDQLADLERMLFLLDGKRLFQKGSGHITFKRMDLVEKMNDIIAKHYPGMLAAK